MKSFLSLVCHIIVLGVLTACTPAKDQQSKDEQYLHQQEQEQGYPVLIAIPKSADYGLPFCEKQYCIDIEIFGFQSQDHWFNQDVEQKIADIIRQQLGMTQKLSLQKAVNEFVRLSDEWQEKHANQPWNMFIEPRVVFQQREIAILQIHTEYTIENKTIPAQQFYYVIDRKGKKTIRLYDIIQENARLAFGDYLQNQYQQWLSQQLSDSEFPEKIYWANQDWFIDEEGLVIYYRGKELNPQYTGNDLTIYLTPEQSHKWLKSEYLTQIQLDS